MESASSRACFAAAEPERSSSASDAETGRLAVPAMNRVFSRVRAMGVDIDPAVYTVEQAKAAILDALRKKGGR